MLPKITPSDLFSHPDKNPDDPLAHEKFRDISDAYEVCFFHKFGFGIFCPEDRGAQGAQTEGPRRAEGLRKRRGQRGSEMADYGD